jgi:hypothetical protein
MSEKKGAIKKATLDAIGDAVRSKEGSTEPIPVNALADRITALPTPSGDSKFNDYLKGTLTEVTAEDLEGVTEIRRYTFNNVGLKKMTIPNTVTEFGQNSISPALEESHYEGELWEWCKIERVNSYIEMGNLYIKGKLIENIDIIPTREMLQGTYKEFFITHYAFYRNPNLKTVRLRDASKRYSLRAQAFSQCPNLTRVDIEPYKISDYPGNTKVGMEMPSSLFSGSTNVTDIYVSWSEGTIKNAPWGAINATIHYNTPVPFYVDDKKYLMNVTMTWAQWCDSEFNTDGFYIDENDSNYVKNANGDYLIFQNWEYVWNLKTSSTKIVSEVYNYRTEV